jgi:DNA-binding IclR family transcriptional regulator
MGQWRFLTNHCRVLLCISNDPDARLRDIADLLAITERRTYAIVNDLTVGGYLVKHKDGRRNRYEVQADRPLGESNGRSQAISELLALLTRR